MIQKNEEPLNKFFNFPFAKETLSAFLQREDNNLKFFYEMRPQLDDKNRLELSECKIPRGFFDISHQRFYIDPQKFLGTQELESMKKLEIWNSALNELIHVMKCEDINKEYKLEIRENITNFMERNYLDKYRDLSQKITSIQEEYFSNILIASSKLNKKNPNSYFKIYDMNYRDEIFRKIFPDKSSYENFFFDYIHVKYNHQKIETITTTFLFDIHDRFLVPNETKKKLFFETANLQNKLSDLEVLYLERLEKKLIQNRADVRIYNSKFKEHFDYEKNIYDVVIDP